MWWRIGARLPHLRPTALAAAAGLVAGALHTTPGCEGAHSPPCEGAHSPPLPHGGRKELPTFSRAEVAAHAGADGSVWVTFGDNVYDISRFVADHPGGVEKIMTAAGQAVEPYWSLYRQHLQRPGQPKEHVEEILRPLLIGKLDPAEAAAAAAARARDPDDPYADEPLRHPALKLLSQTPCSAECPAALSADAWLTPNELFFVRNHHPVPRLDASTFTVEVSGLGVSAGSLTLQQLQQLPKHTLTATLQCGGNRRAGLNATGRKTSGNAWGVGAMSNAEWGGVLLRDVLAARGLSDPARAGARHVQFEGVDGTKASIPIEKALSEAGDVLLAYEMNGEALPRDHGHPLRVVVPGHVGVRNIKWLRTIKVSDEEAEGVWQRGIAYKTFGPGVSSLEGIDVAALPAMQEMPVQSFILSPGQGARMDPGEETVTVRGAAWSGGGRGIIRVDVSGDGGSTWHTAKLTEGASQPAGRAWAWTFWEAEVPFRDPSSSDAAAGTASSAAAPPSARSAQIVCKAVDASHNTQPERASSVWNLRGLANNSWHRVDVTRRAPPTP